MLVESSQWDYHGSISFHQNWCLDKENFIFTPKMDAKTYKNFYFSQVWKDKFVTFFNQTLVGSLLWDTHQKVGSYVPPKCLAYFS